MNWIVARMKWIMLYGAFHLPSRPMALVVAGLSKVIFIGLVLIYGRQFLDKARVPVVVDSVMVVLFACYLLAMSRRRSAG